MKVQVNSKKRTKMCKVRETNNIVHGWMHARMRLTDWEAHSANKGQTMQRPS